MKRNLSLEYRVRKLEIFLEKVIDGKLPKYFYHGTTTIDAEHIVKDGLKPSKLSKRIVHDELTNKSKVYLTDSLSNAKGWAAAAAENIKSTGGADDDYNPNDYAVLRIDSTYLDPDLLEADHNAYGKGKNTKLFSFNINNNVSDCEYTDFEYKGIIPAEAITIIWKSDSSSITDVNNLVKYGNLADAIKNWDKYKDADLGVYNFPYLFAKIVLKKADLKIPDWNNNKFKQIIFNIPPNILNHELKDLRKTMLNCIIDIDPYNDNISDMILDLAKKFGNKLSNLNIELLWEGFANSVTNGTVDRDVAINVIKKLPESFIKIGNNGYIDDIKNSD